MAEIGTTGGAVPAGTARPPRIAPLLALYTLARLGIAAALIALLWVVGLVGLPALLFGVLLQMPVSYIFLRPIRDRLTEAFAARGEARKAAKADLRARLAGTGTDD